MLIYLSILHVEDLHVDLTVCESTSLWKKDIYSLRLNDGMKRFVVLRDDKALVYMNARDEFTWKLVSGDR